MAQQQRKGSSDAEYIAKYIDEQNKSSDEEPEIEVFEMNHSWQISGNINLE